MARLFDDAATQFLERTSAVVSGTPLTMACWFQTNDLTLEQVLMQVAADASANVHFLYFDGVTAGDPVAVYSESSAANDLSRTGAASVNTWHHAAGVWTSATSRTPYFDGTAGTANTTNVAPTGFDKTSIGRARYNSTDFWYLSGRIAEAAVWNVALTADEIAMLSRGFSPLFVRPADLAAYWPLVGRSSPEFDLIGALDLTVTGATQAEHTRIVYPTVAQTYHVAAAAANEFLQSRIHIAVP